MANFIPSTNYNVYSNRTRRMLFIWLRNNASLKLCPLPRKRHRRHQNFKITLLALWPVHKRLCRRTTKSFTIFKQTQTQIAQTSYTPHAETSQLKSTPNDHEQFAKAVKHKTSSVLRTKPKHLPISIYLSPTADYDNTAVVLYLGTPLSSINERERRTKLFLVMRP